MWGSVVDPLASCSEGGNEILKNGKLYIVYCVLYIVYGILYIVCPLPDKIKAFIKGARTRIKKVL